MFKVNGIISPFFKRYLVYNSISNFICGIETTMSTHSMFTASGVIDNNNVDIYSILFNMTVKDMIGQFACIPAIPLIASISKYGDMKPLKYLGINIAIFEVSTIIEHITPLIRSELFIPIAGLANIGKTVGLTGISSFNIGMINKISSDGKNIMEISSKISSISTASFAFGSMIGLGVVKFIPCYEVRLGLLFPMGLLRYWLSMKAVEGLINNK